MKKLIYFLLLPVAVCLLPVSVYAHDYERSESYQKYDTYGDHPINPPGSQLNPYVTERTDSYGNKETYETHEKVWTPPSDNKPLFAPGTRLNPYITERVK
jgi:hypothetical protein